MESVAVDVAPPESPESPEAPEAAVPFEAAADVAAPVSPLLVADAWALEVPDAAVVAVGLTVRLAAPPAPASASAVPTVAPVSASGLPATAPPMRARTAGAARRPAASTACAAGAARADAAAAAGTAGTADAAHAAGDHAGRSCRRG